MVTPGILRRSASLIPATFAVVLLTALAGCAGPLPIAEVRQRSQELQGQQVTVEGQVVERVDLPLLRDRYYQIDDGSERIWVQTVQPTPAEGARVVVTGTLGPGIRVPGMEVGLVIVESERR